MPSPFKGKTHSWRRANEDFDRRLVAFIRLGTDYQDNYYQIEVPLKPTAYIENSSNRLRRAGVAPRFEFH